MNRMAGVIAGVLVSSACGAPPSSVPVAPALTRLQLTRAGELSGPGATSQVKAEALYSNGTRRDVTAAARWSVIPSTVASVDASGMLTALALGLASVNATYGEAGQSRFGSLSVVVTPPGTFVLAGRVREPAAGPLEGVTVLHLASGTSVTTGRDGGFSLPGMTSRRLSLQKPGYESVELDASPNFAIDPPLQRIARLRTGSSTALTLAPNDMEYGRHRGRRRVPALPADPHPDSGRREASDHGPVGRRGRRGQSLDRRSGVYRPRRGPRSQR